MQAAEVRPLREAYAGFVRVYLTRALEAGGWRVVNAAKIADVHRDYVYYLIERYAPELRAHLAPPLIRMDVLMRPRQASGGNAAWRALDTVI